MAEVKSCIRSGVRWLGAGIALAAGAYASYVGITWLRPGLVVVFLRPICTLLPKRKDN